MSSGWSGVVRWHSESALISYRHINSENSYVIPPGGFVKLLLGVCFPVYFVICMGRDTYKSMFIVCHRLLFVVIAMVFNACLKCFRLYPKYFVT